MDKDLHKILMELEYKVDVDIPHYFSLSETDKQELSLRIIEHFIPFIKNNPRGLWSVKNGMYQLNKEAEGYEHYEQADIFLRCLRDLEELT